MKHQLFIFSFFILILFSCSSEDDNNSENSCSNFLECHNGTDWKWEDGNGYLEYWSFSNNSNNPFTIYYYNDYEFDQPCLQVIPISEFNFNITENSINKLVIHQYVSNADYSFYTFELNNGIMSLTLIEYEGNVIVDEDYSILFEESVNTSNIPICN